MLTHDNSKLLVVHTGRQSPARTATASAYRHRDQPAAAVAHPSVGRQPPSSSAASSGSTRGDISPDDSYFVVTQRLRRRPPADQRHGGRVPVDRRRPTSSRCGSPALRQRLLGRDHREGRLHRRPLPAGTSRRPHRTRGRGSTTSATARARASRLRPRRRSRPARPHRRARPGDRQGARVEPGLQLLRGQQGHAGHPARPLRGRRRHDPGWRDTSGASPSTTSTPCPARRRATRPRSSIRSRGASKPTDGSSRSTAPRPRRAASSASSSRSSDRDTHPVPPGRPDHLGGGEHDQREPGVRRNATSTTWSLPADPRRQPPHPALRQDLRRSTAAATPRRPSRRSRPSD